jgi:cytoskeletal protein CcmA (bactofilin family)
MRSRNKKPVFAPKSSDPAPVAPPPPAEKHQSLIGASLQFVGEIRSTGSVRIEGQVTGTVSARSLTVGQGGEISGRVVAQIAQIDGRVDGDLEADTVVLGPTAQVFGDIIHHSLTMAPGAHFEGRSVMSAAGKPAGKTDPDAAAPAAAAHERVVRPN